MQKTIQRIVVVGIFAIAMAYLESVIVVYLRDIYGINNLLTDLITEVDKYVKIEIGREIMTLIMLASIGIIAGKNLQEKFSYTVFAFGIWDIFYYIWLYVFIGWPQSLFEWDILFLVPLPWWGPVLSPVLIAILMCAGAVIVILKSFQNIKVRLNLYDWLLFSGSILFALVIFMEDAIRVLPGGIDAVARVRPTTFSWPLFLIPIVGMTYFVFRLSKKKPV
ncbi:MAG: hypothetical protein JXR31_08840 [Prolixibacteraceae bacterium]|nr:hypothetical protein [Prolixibacteraceae bacterium]